MALRQLMIRKKIETLNKQLDAAREKAEGYKTRKEEIEKREAELEAALDETTEETTEEEKATLDESVEKFEADKKALEDEEAENEAEKTKIEDEIRDLEKELKDLDERSKTPPAGSQKENEREGRKVENHMATRSKFFKTYEERAAFVARDEIKQFLERVRGLKAETRSVTGGELGIPDVMLELLRDNLNLYSKLITKVRLKPVKGKARQNITGAVPEGIWTEAVGELNELSLVFTQKEVDGYKVGGFIPIPNPTLEDSDFNLAEEIMDALGQAIGYAVDKAVLFGTGSKMPVGFLTRLAQTSQPSGWDTNGPEWTDLHSTNLTNINPASYTTAQQYFAALMLKLAIAKPNYSSSGKPTWIMNRLTHMTLLSKCIEFNAAAALVAGMNDTMPVIGGEIIELEFMNDNDIAGGFLDLYLLAERSGAFVTASEHVRFIKDQTVFKGTARYDGEPIFGEAFVGVNINNSSVTTSKSFAVDAANTVETPKALPVAGEYAAAQNVALSCDTPGATIYYTVDGSTPDATKTAYNGPIAVAATTTIKAIAIKEGMTNSAVMSAVFTITE